MSIIRIVLLSEFGIAAKAPATRQAELLRCDFRNFPYFDKYRGRPKNIVYCYYFQN